MAEKRDSRKEFSPEAMDVLRQYDWPGNIRELEHLVEKLYVTLRKKVIEERDILDILPQVARQSQSETGGRVRVKKLIPLRLAADAVERELLQLAAECCGTEEEIAQVLGGSQSNISRKMKRHGVRIDKRKATDE
jgi:DNA-binding NtrC family response regulator